MGKLNWYMPRWLDRIVPHVSIEGAGVLRSARREARRGRARARTRSVSASHLHARMTVCSKHVHWISRTGGDQRVERPARIGRGSKSGARRSSLRRTSQPDASTVRMTLI